MSRALPLRVLLVNDFYAPHMIGGAETLVQGLAAGLLTGGHTVAVATARLAGLPPQDVVAGVSIYRLGTFPAVTRATRVASGTAPGVLTVDTAQDFRAVLAAFRPDVVHFHNIWLLGPALVHLAPGRKGMTLHDYWPICVRRTLIRVTGQACSGPEPGACRLCRLRAPASWRSLNLPNIERERAAHAVLLAACDFVTAPSRFLAQQVAGADQTRIVVVPNGIALPGVCPVPGRQAAYVLFASRPVVEKGYAVALAAFASAELHDIQLYAAGDAPASAAANVRVLGQQTPAAMPALIAAAQCVVVPSLWPENCPMIILEALRAGVPVVASRIGGIPEIIEDGVTGLLVTPGDATALATAIRRACTDPILRTRAQQQGPQLVQDRFSLAIMLGHLERLYAAEGDRVPGAHHLREERCDR